MQVWEYVRIVRARWWLVLLALVCATAASYLWARTQTPLYRSTTSIVFVPARPDQGQDPAMRRAARVGIDDFRRHALDRDAHRGGVLFQPRGVLIPLVTAEVDHLDVAAAGLQRRLHRDESLQDSLIGHTILIPTGACYKLLHADIREISLQALIPWLLLPQGEGVKKRLKSLSLRERDLG